MKTIFVLLFLFSCSTSTIKTDGEVPSSPETPVVVDTKPTSIPDVDHGSTVIIPGSSSEYDSSPTTSANAIGVFTTNIKTINYNSTQQAKVDEAAKYIKIIMNSAEYKQEVLGFTYGGKKQFVDNKGMTNEQIYNHLKGGAEALNPVINYQMDITLQMYYKSNSTVGYTYPSDTKIYTNSKFHNSYSSCQVASNTTHEWTHKMGFSHAQKWSNSRDYSVPYGHNSIIEKLCSLAKSGKLTPLKPEILPLAPTP